MMILLVFIKLFLKIQYVLLLVGAITSFIKAIRAANEARREKEAKKSEDIIGEMELDKDGETPVYKMSRG